MLATIHKGARAALRAGRASTREYSLYEIAIVTRAGPARILGIQDRHGHLGPGAVADVTVYEDHPDRERMFAQPALLLKAGQPGDARRRGARARTCAAARTSSAPATTRPSAAGSAASSRTTATCGWARFELADGEIEDGGRGLRRGARLPRPRLSGGPSLRQADQLSRSTAMTSSGRPQRPQSLRYIADALGFGWFGVSW